MSDDEHLRVIELAVAERPAGVTIIGGTGSNDTRHAVHLTERATELGVDATLSVTPVLQPAEPAGDHASLRGDRAGHRSSDHALQHPAPAPGRTCAPDLLAAAGRRSTDVSARQAGQPDDELQLIDGLEIYAGNDETFARTLDMGGAGGILVASHVVGDEMRRMVDEPDNRAEIDASLQRRLRDAVHHRQPDVHEGRPEPDGPARAARCGCRSSRRSRTSSRRCARCSSATAGWRPRQLELDPARPAARRPGRDRQEHDGRRVRRPDRRRRRRSALPDAGDDGHRPRPARLLATCASASTTSRRSSSPTATRIISARCRSSRGNSERSVFRRSTAAS